jgi:formate/nitrite transporter FocA (FNT family)
MRECIRGILAGLCISLGGSVFLACESRVVGSVLFCVALLTICYFGFSLYTGKIGYIVENHSGKDVALLLFGLLGNLIGCLAFGLMIRYGLPSLADKAAVICSAKLSQTAIQALIRAFFCGVLMYIAVWVFKNKNNSIVGILVCIPTFILSGFEHSIADAFYFSVVASFSIKSILYILMIIIGNTVGGCAIPLLMKLLKEKEA